MNDIARTLTLQVKWPSSYKINYIVLLGRHFKKTF